MMTNYGSIGDPISCGADPEDKLSLNSRGIVNFLNEKDEYVGKQTLRLLASKGNSYTVSIYMDREKVEELATYLMYWLHETKDSE